jgi:CSLREA domain-containing protein
MKYLFAGLKLWALVVFLMFAAGGAQATVWVVTKTQDTDDGVCDADCSLREAVDVAISGDTIWFSSLFTSPQTLTLTNGVIGLNEDLTIDGPGADLLTIDGNNGAPFQHVFFIESWATATLSEMTLTNSGVNMFSSIGNTGTLTVERCSLSGNLSAAAILNLGTATIDSTTVSENNGVNGGGIENYGVLTLTNSTVSNNHADFIFQGGSGGIYSEGESLTITNSTISGNLKSGANDNGGGIWTNNQTTITASTIANNEVTLAGFSNASGVFAEGPAIVTVRNTIIAANVNKPVVGYVAGFTAPEGKTMGHAGAIVSGSSGTAAAKKEALEAAGVRVGKTPSETASLMRKIMTSL